MGDRCEIYLLLLGTDLKFWRHEWEKHGTCASIKPEVSGIYKFFNKTLELNRKYDLLIAYESVGFVD